MPWDSRSSIFFVAVLRIVKKIPFGKVATYGQIAALAGNPRAAYMVGWILHQEELLRPGKLPWQRVINREGRISTTCFEHPPQAQVALLKKEKIRVELRGDNYFVDLKKYLWDGRV
jgi:methylated-DNA-protein-cysteine methyltransferase-like protein